MSDDKNPFEIPDPEGIGWAEDPARPGFWLWEKTSVEEAPEDGKQYCRQDADWTEAVTLDHTHDIDEVNGLQAELDAIAISIDAVAGQLVFGGTYDAATDTVVRGMANGLSNLTPLPSDGVIEDTFLIVVVPGQWKKDGSQLNEGDWIVANRDGIWSAIQYTSTGSGTGVADWNTITNKPTEFPPEAHNHGISDVTGLQTELDDLEAQIIAKEDGFYKNTAFNKNFGTTAGTVAEGDHNHDADYLKDYTETDPIFTASVASGITQTDIDKWNAGTADAKDNYQYWRYQIDGFSTTSVNTMETVNFVSGDNMDISKDASGNIVFKSTAASTGAGNDPRISDTQITNWDAAFLWGDHSGAGYLTSTDLTGLASEAWVQSNYQPIGTYITNETDPVFAASPAGSITSQQISDWDAAAAGGGSGDDPRIADTDIADWNEAYGWGDHSRENYATETWVNGKNYATQTWVTNQSYATQTWVTSQSYATQSWVTSNYQPAGSYATAGSSYTKAESDTRYQLAGSGGSYVPLSGNSTIAGVLTATDFVASSDERLKKNVCTAPTGVIDKIRGVEFEWKQSGQMSSGVIAQELEAVPELAHLVHTGEEDGTKHVSYLGLIGYLIEEVKQLRAEIEELK